MSGPIRMVIGPTRSRLSRLLGEAESPAISQFVAVDPSKSKEDNIQRQKQFMFELKTLIERIRSAVHILETKNGEWSQLIQSLSGPDRNKEEEIYASTTEPSDSFVEVLLQGKDKLVVLENQLTELDYTLDQYEKTVTSGSATSRQPRGSRSQASSVHSLSGDPQLQSQDNIDTQEYQFVSPVTPAFPRPQEPNQGIKLPKLPLMSFNGDATRFKAFWDFFEQAVHNQPISNIQKFVYLISKLEGKAAQVVQGISMSNENYDIVVKTLFERFGSNRIVRQTLYQKLDAIRTSSNRVEDLENTYDAIEQLLHQLEAIKENLDQASLVHSIMQKYPYQVVMKLEELHASESDWTMSELRAQLKTIISIQKRASTTVGFNKVGSVSPNNNKPTRGNGRFQPRREQTVPPSRIRQDNLVLSNASETVRKAPSDCVFCGGDHFYDMCKKFRTLDARKDQLSLKQLCFYCFKPGHSQRSCSSYQTLRPCYYCKFQTHPSALCPKTFGIPPATSKGAQANTRGPKSGVKAPAKSNPKKSFYNSNRSQPQSQRGVQISQGVYSVMQKSSDVQCDTSRPATTTQVPQTQGAQPPIGILSSLTMTNQLNSMLGCGKSMLLTATVSVCNPVSFKTVQTRAFLDTGSEKSFVSSKLVAQLGLEANYSEVLSVLPFGTQKPKEVSTQHVNIVLQLRDSSLLSVGAYSVQHLTGKLQRSALSSNDLQKVQLLPAEQFADTIPVVAERFKPDMLLGINYFFDLVFGEATKLPSGLFIVPSKLGFLIGGCNVLQKDDEHRSETTPVSFRTNVNMSVAALNLFSKPDTPLQVVPNLQDLWNLESLGMLDDPTVNDDDQALRNFNKNIKFEEGRYQLKWLWNSSEPNLPENRKLAFKRFQNMILKNADNVEFITAYDNVIKDQLKQGVIEKVSKEDEVSGLLHYIPHQAVVTPGRTTKLRIVYDASSKYSKCLNSFNDCLYRGPILLPDLAGILIRIRNHRIALTSDIAKAFLQMSIQEDQRDVTRFFWLKDVNYQPILHPDNIQIFRFTRVLFGAKASPSMLNLTIDFHLSKYDSPVAKKVRRNIYVDNLITGTANLKDAVALYQETKMMFRDASMNIREWDSNEKEFREALPEVDQATPKSARKILGLQWNHSDDTLSVPSGKTNLTENLTKRQVVEMVSSIFDPLGFVNPVTLGCKLFIQYLWRLKLQWDDLLSDDQRERFHQLITELKDVSSFTVPRFICGLNDSKNPATYDLLGFVDGSLQAFAAVIYLRVSTEKASEVHLIFAKTRLLPIKGLSIPRSELMGLLIGVRLIKFLSKELDLPIEKKYIWCDSQCVLHWLKSTRKLPVFVENRVKEIKASKDITFCYIDTQLTPADMGTRPHNWEEFQAKRQFWLHGPPFASLSKSVWPQFNMPELTPELLDSLEQTASEKPDTVVKKQNTNAVVVSAVRKVPAIFSIQGYTVVRLLRITVVILRFLKFLIWDKLSIDTKKKQSFLGKLFNQIISVANEKEHFIRTREMKIAQTYWERCVQKEAFPEVFQCIEQGKKHHLVKQLHLFLDQNGILRLSGRLGNTELPFDAAHPKLLPSKHAFTKALINEWHQKLFHGGVQATLAAIRQEYFVLQGRRNVKHVIDQCTKCRKAYGPPYKLPDMPPSTRISNLPSTRINRCRPFQFVGLDYFGPVSIKTAMEHVKIWVCLFTCFVTRAIHLEPVTDMSAEKFILCLRRYIARRGRPEKILSDNASQFKLAKKAVDQVWNSAIRNDDVMSYCGKEKIEWTFITELAPWKGGMYERMVGLVKRVIKQALGRNIVSFETILTYLSEAEAVVNSRPMTYIYEDGKSLRILRPIDFLLPYGAIGSEVLEENHEDPEYLPTLDSSGKILKFWRSSQRFLDKCWNFFLKEYVVALHERFQFAHKQGKSVSHLIPKPGAVVLLHEENLPRGSWKLAIIQKVLPDTLGIIRSAVIQMPNKNQLTRPINCLYPLELDVEVNDEESTTNSHNGEQQEQCARITRSMARKTKKTTPLTSFNLIWSTVYLNSHHIILLPNKSLWKQSKMPK